MITLETNVISAEFHGINVTIYSGKKDWIVVYSNKFGQREKSYPKADFTATKAACSAAMSAHAVNKRLG